MMVRKLTCLLALTCGCILLMSAQAPAQKEKKVEKTTEEIKHERMKKLLTAYDLAAEGRKKNAPEYLITAAGMLRNLSALKDLQEMKKLDVKPEITGPGKADLDMEVKMPTLRERSDEWFKEASDMGATAGVNVDKLIKLAKERETSDKEERAVVGGPRMIAHHIGSGQTHTFNFNLFTHGPTAWQFQSNGLLHVSVAHRGPANDLWFDYVTAYGGQIWYPVGRNPAYYAKLKTAGIVIRVENNNNQPVYYQMMIE